MGVALGFQVYPLTALYTTIPDLVVPPTLFITCLVCQFLYPLHISDVALDDAQRVLQEVGKRYSAEVIKALLQELVLSFGQPA